MKTIQLSEIKTGDCIFLEGKSSLANQIKKAQRQKGNVNWHMNHVGLAVVLDNNLCVAEEDYPGRFDINIFHEQYAKNKDVVYLGRVIGKQLDDKMTKQLAYDLLERASDNRLTDYAFLDILSFKLNAIIYKITKRDVWIGRKKNRRDRYTCSQITALYLKNYFNILKEKSHIQYTPADIADSIDIELYKIIY